MTAPERDQIADAVLVATTTLRSLYASVPVESATAKGALNSAAEALGVFERQARLIGYEAKRQTDIAQRRAEKQAAEAKVKAEQDAAREERRHVSVLVAAGEKIAAEKAAREHFAKKGSTK